jgi:hypothetical protein
VDETWFGITPLGDAYVRGALDHNPRPVPLEESLQDVQFVLPFQGGLIIIDRGHRVGYLGEEGYLFWHELEKSWVLHRAFIALDAPYLLAEAEGSMRFYRLKCGGIEHQSPPLKTGTSRLVFAVAGTKVFYAPQVSPELHVLDLDKGTDLGRFTLSSSQGTQAMIALVKSLETKLLLVTNDAGQRRIRLVDEFGTAHDLYSENANRIRICPLYNHIFAHVEILQATATGRTEPLHKLLRFDP